MNSSISRRSFIAAASGGCIALPLAHSSSNAHAQSADDRNAASAIAAFPQGFPSHEPALVREIVGKSHADLDAVKRMVEARPALAKAAWDWGFGDWESALGAASHVGRPDIAEVLMAHGARPDIFTFAMLGNLDAVKAIIAANPGIQRTHGPHDITLLSHARAGKEKAAAVVEYLQSLGDADQAATDLPIEPALRTAMIGEYVYDLGTESSGSAHIKCAIVDRRGTLMFQHLPDGSLRNLRHQGDGAFHPAGAPRVRIRFTEHVLAISDGQFELRARKHE